MDMSKTLEDIFDIPTDGSNMNNTMNSDDDSESSYSSVVDKDNSLSFEDKASFVNNEISLEEKNNDIEYLDNVDDLEEKDERESNQSSLENIIEESISAKSVITSQNTKMEFQQTTDNTDSKEIDIHEKNVGIQEELSNSTIEGESKLMSGLSNQWQLETNDISFQPFYKEKKNILPRILLGGELPFEKMESELIRARADLKGISLYDHEVLSGRMYEIQQWRDRVIEIQLRASRQYFLWKRAVELLKGILMNIEYLKPIGKQDGLNYKHLSDFEFYFERLASLYESSKAVLKNLDAGFEYCSRLITLSLPQKQTIKPPNDTSIRDSSIDNENYKNYDGLNDINNHVEGDKEKSKKTIDSDGWDL